MLLVSAPQSGLWTQLLLMVRRAQSEEVRLEESLQAGRLMLSMDSLVL